MQTISNISNNLVIKVENLTKIYRYSGIMSSIFSRGYKGEVRALENINLDVYKGEILGIIGGNGSGKSTLLKILSGVTIPSSGTAYIYGKLFAAIEVTGGFNPDLTGYNNLIITAKIWGFSNKEISNLLPEIIAFSDLEDFIHLPIKKYSSGMISRLASSLIIHSNADIMLLDEVLNGSDIAFRQKMHKKIIEENNKGKTIIIASHIVNDILALCTRVVIINKGIKIFEGNPFKALNIYKGRGNSEKNESVSFVGHLENTFIKLLNTNINQSSEEINFNITLKPKTSLSSELNIVLIINNNIESPIAHSIFKTSFFSNIKTFNCKIPNSIIGSGHHFISIAVYVEPDHWAFFPRVCSFMSNNNALENSSTFLPGISLSNAEWVEINNE